MKSIKNVISVHFRLPEGKQIGFHSLVKQYSIVLPKFFQKKFLCNRFPKDNELCSQWKYSIEVCNKQTSFGRNPRVCSSHFKETDITTSKKNTVLKRSAIPSIFPNSG